MSEFTPGKISIVLSDQQTRQEVEAEICETVAVHLLVTGGYYTVTHIPSGVGCCSFLNNLTRDEAKAVASLWLHHLRKAGFPEQETSPEACLQFVRDHRSDFREYVNRAREKVAKMRTTVSDRKVQS